MEVIVVNHPLARQSLTVLRSLETGRAQFRQELYQLTTFLAYESTREWPTAQTVVETPLGAASGYRVTAHPLLVPIMRAGLGMLDAVTTLFPDSQVGFVGLKRNEKTFIAHKYLDATPPALVGQPVLLLDPMLATGGSVVSTCENLARKGAGDISVLCVLAAPEGIEHVDRSGLAKGIYTAGIDERLNDIAFIVPGLGDAGDRQFGEY